MPVRSEPDHSAKHALRAARLSIALLALPMPVHAQVALTKPYLMAFHVCEGTLCQDFRNHSVYLAESADGAAWTLVPGWTPFAGSVPDVIHRGRTLYFYTSPSMVARYSLDAGVSDLVPVAVHGLPSGGVSDWVDASLYVDEEGRLVLFMMHAPAPTPDRPPSDPASCPPDVTSCTKEFLSATEVPGSNGTEFVVDAGVRATTTISSVTPPRTAADPDIFFDGTQYVLYISHGPSTSVWTSPTLRGTYTLSTRLPSGLLSDGRGGVPAGHFDVTTSRYWTYTHLGQAGTTVIRRAVHAALTTPLEESLWEPVITGQSLGLGSHISVESPSFAVLISSAPALEPAPTVACAFLTAPGPLTATVVGHDVTFVWGGASGASGYTLELGRAAGASNVATGQLAGAETSITVRNVPPGSHYVRVRARNACGETTVSREIVLTLKSEWSGFSSQLNGGGSARSR